MSNFLETYGHEKASINIGEHKVEGTVNLPLSEVDRLRGAIVNRDRLISDLQEKQKKVKITLRQKTVKSKTYHPIGDSSYEQNYEEWEEVHSYKNLDDIMDGLKATVKEEVTKNYSNQLEKSEKKVDNLNNKLTTLQIEYNTCSEQLPILEEELKEEKSKNSSIKEEYDTILRLNEKLEKDLEMSRNREMKLRNLLDSETILGKLSKFFGIN